jgi:ring-1,2-phenylacetyl-CoA epoxidase subunit PaaC
MKQTKTHDYKEDLKISGSSKVPRLIGGFREALLLHLADTTLILAQRNAEWCGHGPILEQDIAITNISLDLLGQARNFYQYAAKLINESKIAEGSKVPSPLERASPDASGAGGEVDEDKLAYLRTEREFKNLLLVEQPNGDWGQTILRQYLFSQFQYLLFEKLQYSKDEQLAAITAKALKEIKYHLRWSSEWVIRLGDGTDESKQKMLKAIDELWRYTGEMFIPADYEKETCVDFTLLKEAWLQKVKAVFDEATISSPFGGGWEGDVFMQTGGKEGIHTEHLGFILTELQYLQRAYPNSMW